MVFSIYKYYVCINTLPQVEAFVSLFYNCCLVTYTQYPLSIQLTELVIQPIAISITLYNSLKGNRFPSANICKRQTFVWKREERLPSRIWLLTSTWYMCVCRCMYVQKLDVYLITPMYCKSLTLLYSLLFRYQFFLQLKRDVLNGRIPLAFDALVELCSLVVQCKLYCFGGSHTFE